MIISKSKLIMEDKFNFWVPIDIEKAKTSKEKSTGTDDDSRYDNMVFEGVASDSSEDDEGESMNPNGFILDRFLKSGLLNLDHLTSRSKENKSRFWIGEPLDAWVKDNKFFVKGKLWKKSPEARAFWDKCIQMAESGSTRKPGMSIEGKVIERDKTNPRKVSKALITNVALTFQPVNTNSFFDIIKGRQSADFIDYEFESDKDFDEGDKVILEWEDERGNLLMLDTKFKIKVKKKPQYKVKTIEKITKSFKSGLISEKVYRDFVKKIEKNFRLSN